MVEIEVRKAEAGSEKSTTLDINDIISKISEFAARIKEMSGDGKPMGCGWTDSTLALPERRTCMI